MSSSMPASASSSPEPSAGPATGPAGASAEPSGSLFTKPSADPGAVGSSETDPVELRGAGAEELVALMRANDRGHRRGRTLAVIAAVIGIVALGTGGVYAVQQLTDKGPQPESVLPSTTVAFVKVDLDPSASQKVDALRFLRSFPAADTRFGATADLRRIAFEALQERNGLGTLDYAEDVEPWLGQRLGFGLVPDPAAKEGSRPVVALSVTDPAVAERHLPALANGLGVQCRVLEEFAVCTGGGTTAALDTVLAATARGSLADAATYRQDMDDLGEDGVVSFWSDSAKAAEAASTVGEVVGRPVPRLLAAAGGSSTSMALRFDGPNLELVGHVNGVATKRVAEGDARPIGGLPWNTLAAVSVAQAGPQLRASWPRTQAAIVEAMGTKEYTRGLAQVEKALGIAIPEDLAAGLGSRFTAAYGGSEPGKGPKVAVVGDGDPDVLRTVADRAVASGAGSQPSVRPAGRDTIVSTSDGYAQEVATTRGLGEMPAFAGAIKDLDEAQFALYVDISGLRTQFADELERAPVPAADAWANLSALGVTASADGTSAEFRIRLTTK